MVISGRISGGFGHPNHDGVDGTLISIDMLCKALIKNQLELTKNFLALAPGTPNTRALLPRPPELGAVCGQDWETQKVGVRSRARTPPLAATRHPPSLAFEDGRCPNTAYISRTGAALRKL
jgi:hypothetical protein